MSAAPQVARILAENPRLPPGAAPPGTAGRILEIGLELFARKGFHGTSIRDLGRELGLKPANLYDHFASKEHLLAELVRLGHAEHLQQLRRALVLSDGSPADQVRALVIAHVRMHAEYAMLAVVANTEMHVLSRELVAPALALRQQAEGLLMDVVQRGVLSEVFDPPDPFLAAAAIGGMGMRVAHWFRPGPNLSIVQLCEGYAELALRMLGVRSGARRR
jgi:AcrR family transcriptional regulator